MFAKYWIQDKEIREIFYKKIQEKIKKQKEKMMKDLDESLPKILSILAKPIANLSFEWKRLDQESQGIGGEEDVSNALWFWLPKNYNVFDNVVLEPEEDEFIQIDHLIVAPQGIFIIEVKTWEGAIFITENIWRLKKGDSWVKIENPIKQNERHVRLFKKWLKDNFPDKEFLQNIIYPVIVLKKTSWFKVHESVKMPIVEGGLGAIGFIKRVKGDFISDDLAEEICLKIKFAKLYEKKTVIEEGVSKSGREYVRIKGDKGKAEEIRNEYIKKGYKVFDLNEDKFEKEVFYFYYEE